MRKTITLEQAQRHHDNLNPFEEPDIPAADQCCWCWGEIEAGGDEWWLEYGYCSESCAVADTKMEKSKGRTKKPARADTVKAGCLPLEIKRPEPGRWRNPESRLISLRACPPWVWNKRAQLVHRPRYVHIAESWYGGTPPKAHISFNHHCGAQHTGSFDKFDFLRAPDMIPERGFAERVLCEVCEQKAVERGLPTSREIAGKHVHVGHCRAVKTCCPNEQGGES